MPDLNLIKRAEQGVRDERRRFLRVKMANDTPTQTLPIKGEGLYQHSYLYSRPSMGAGRGGGDACRVRRLGRKPL